MLLFQRINSYGKKTKKIWKEVIMHKQLKKQDQRFAKLMSSDKPILKKAMKRRPLMAKRY